MRPAGMQMREARLPPTGTYQRSVEKTINMAKSGDEGAIRPDRRAVQTWMDHWSKL